MAVWKGWAAGLSVLVLACGDAGGGVVSRRSGADGAGAGGGPGSMDAGQPPSDAGTGGAPADDAGTGGGGTGSGEGGTAGPVDAGTADGGTDGGAGDGGVLSGDAGDGGAGGPPACVTPAAADVCHSLNPRLGAPVVHEEMEVHPGSGEGVLCGTGAYPASGTGVVLHPMQPEYRPPRFDFIDRTGAQIGTFGDFSLEGFDMTVVAEDTGFAFHDPFIGGIGYYPLFFVDDHGVGHGSGGSGFRVFELPGGGVGLFSSRETAPGCGEQTGLFVQRFEESGTAAVSDPTDLGCYPQTPHSIMGGNGAGNVLVLVSRLTADWTGWDGIWLDADLRVLGKFSTPELAAAASNKDAAIAALLDGSFVLRFDKKWFYRIQPGASSVGPAPCWLAERPGTDLQVIRDRNAYAVVHHGSTSCDDAMEVFTAEGQSCGPVGPLEPPGDRCEVAIGRDGTLSGSADAADAGAGQPRACLLRFWPAALGPTGL